MSFFASFLTLGSALEDDAVGFLGAAFFGGAALLAEEVSSEESMIAVALAFAGFRGGAAALGRLLAVGFFSSAAFLRGGAMSSSSSSDEVSRALFLRFRETSCLSFEDFVLGLAVGLWLLAELLTELEVVSLVKVCIYESTKRTPCPHQSRVAFHSVLKTFAVG